MAEECVFCGHPDARHRVTDAIASRIAAGEDTTAVLHDHGWSAWKYMKVMREIREAEERVGWVDVGWVDPPLDK